MEPLAELRSRPSNDDAVAAYITMQNEMQAAVSATVPAVVWEPSRDAIRAGCGGRFSNLGGETQALPSSVATGAISDEAWSIAVAAAADVARRYGLTELFTTVDRPGQHQVRFFNPSDGTKTDFLSGVDVVMSSMTGCHLPADRLTTEPSPTR